MLVKATDLFKKKSHKDVSQSLAIRVTFMVVSDIFMFNSTLRMHRPILYDLMQVGSFVSHVTRKLSYHWHTIKHTAALFNIKDVHKHTNCMYNGF